MSLFTSLFGEKRDEEKSSIWHSLDSLATLESALDASDKSKVVLFKHSYRCFISKKVLENLENEISENKLEIGEYYLLDVIKNREISNKIASDFSIEHQSPQCIVIKNKKVISAASHQAISVNQILINE